MGKYVNKPASKEVYPYPSRFGSHSKMVDEVETSKLHDPDVVVCKDENGLYVTEKHRLDNGLADPNRFSELGHRERKLLELAGRVFEIVR